MLRSDLDQRHAEKLFSLANICAGRFDDDLSVGPSAARTFGSPILIEWGTEPNGEWFAWNGKWNGDAAGPARYVEAYRHIVDVMRAAGADNLQWIWHANWDDVPESHWNRLEKYFPGENYCDLDGDQRLWPAHSADPSRSRAFAKRSITSIRA